MHKDLLRRNLKKELEDLHDVETQLRYVQCIVPDAFLVEEKFSDKNKPSSIFCSGNLGKLSNLELQLEGYATYLTISPRLMIECPVFENNKLYVYHPDFSFNVFKSRSRKTLWNHLDIKLKNNGFSDDFIKNFYKEILVLISNHKEEMKDIRTDTLPNYLKEKLIIL